MLKREGVGENWVKKRRMLDRVVLEREVVRENCVTKGGCWRELC